MSYHGLHTTLTCYYYSFFYVSFLYFAASFSVVFLSVSPPPGFFSPALHRIYIPLCCISHHFPWTITKIVPRSRFYGPNVSSRNCLSGTQQVSRGGVAYVLILRQKVRKLTRGLMITTCGRNKVYRVARRPRSELKPGRRTSLNTFFHLTRFLEAQM